MMNMHISDVPSGNQDEYRLSIRLIDAAWGARRVPYFRLLQHLCVLLALIGILTGCGGDNDHSSNQGTSSTPQAPKTSSYNVVTENYYYHYDEGSGSRPFAANYQFSDANYPITVSFARLVSDPKGFDLVKDTEKSFISWANGDPRICAIGGVSQQTARINIILERSIAYGTENNIVGLTTVESDNRPSFRVEVATSYLRSGGNANNNSDYIPLSTDDIAKILAHELGHALGLGHSPERRDLMYYQINSSQGVGYDAYLTYGDAMALWTTLNIKDIHWVAGRPPYRTGSSDTKGLVKDTDLGQRGEIVCIYRKVN